MVKSIKEAINGWSKARLVITAIGVTVTLLVVTWSGIVSIIDTKVHAHELQSMHIGTAIALDKVQIDVRDIQNNIDSIQFQQIKNTTILERIDKKLGPS